MEVFIRLCFFIETGLILHTFCVQSQHTMPFLRYFLRFRTRKTLNLHAASVTKRQIVCIFSEKLHRRHGP